MNLPEIAITAALLGLPYAIATYYFTKDYMKSGIFGLLSGGVAIILAYLLNMSIGNFSLQSANILTIGVLLVSPWIVDKLSKRFNFKNIWIISIIAMVILLVLMNLLFGKTVLLQSVMKTAMTIGTGPFSG